jgi:cytidylate kinase
VTTPLVIAIDGPAAAGKSTTARGVAARLGLLYVDTGAMYRALAVKVLRRGIAPGDQAALEALLPDTSVSLLASGGEVAVLLDGEDVTGEIRNERVGEMASAIATNAAVRVFLVEQQRRLARDGGVVMEGRDIGTVVLPEAELKIYLIAGSAVRSERRWRELVERGQELPLADVRQMIEERDRRDSEREASPLRAAPDAVTIDTTDLTIEDQVEAVIAEAERLRAESSPAGPGD